MNARRPSVPLIAQALIAIAASSSDKSALIGDLEEEFALLSSQSPHLARRWYWRQASLSLPHLVLRRLRSNNAQRFGIAILAAFGALAFTALWDLYVARNAAQTFYSLSGAEGYGGARMVFLAVQIAGVALAGAIIALVAFVRDRPFMHNLVYRLVPIGVVLFAPAMIEIARPSPDYPVWFRLFWMGFAAPALIAGAWAATRFQNMRPR